MSAENVELVEALQPEPGVDLVELMGDDQAWANLMDVFEPIFHPSLKSGFVGRGDNATHDGVDGFRRTWLEWLAPWETYRTEVDRVIDCGENVLVLVRDYGRQAGMTAEVRLDGAAVWTVRGGVIAAAFFYVKREDAVAALGLSGHAVPGYTDRE